MSQENADQLIAFLCIIGGMILVLCLLNWILSMFTYRTKSEPTPVTTGGLTQYDSLAPGEAVVLAWSEAGANPRWHLDKQNELRKNMPVLARALDRMVEN